MLEASELCSRRWTAEKHIHPTVSYRVSPRVQPPESLNTNDPLKTQKRRDISEELEKVSRELTRNYMHVDTQLFLLNALFHCRVVF